MKNEFDTLEYMPLSKAERDGDSISYYARHNVSGEPVKVYIFHNGEHLMAITEKEFLGEDSKTNFSWEGPFNLNKDAYQKFWEGFNVPFKFRGKSFSHASPSELKELSQDLLRLLHQD